MSMHPLPPYDHPSQPIPGPPFSAHHHPVFTEMVFTPPFPCKPSPVDVPSLFAHPPPAVPPPPPPPSTPPSPPPPHFHRKGVCMCHGWRTALPCFTPLPNLHPLPPAGAPLLPHLRGRGICMQPRFRMAPSPTSPICTLPPPFHAPSPHFAPP